MHHEFIMKKFNIGIFCAWVFLVHGPLGSKGFGIHGRDFGFKGRFLGRFRTQRLVRPQARINRVATSSSVPNGSNGSRFGSSELGPPSSASHNLFGRGLGRSELPNTSSFSQSAMCSKTRTFPSQAGGSHSESSQQLREQLPKDGLSGDEILNKGISAIGVTKDMLKPLQVETLRSFAYTGIDDGSFQQALDNAVSKKSFTPQQIYQFYSKAGVAGTREDEGYQRKAKCIRERFQLF